MASLEEVMAGLFGSTQARGAQDELRRRDRGVAAGGYEGIGGAQVLPGQMLPYLLGQRNYDYSGPMGRDFQGGGLAALLAHQDGGGGPDFSGPVGRHFQNQGFDFMPPGLQNQNPIAGPNVAPGNLDTGQALDQPVTSHPGLAIGQTGAPPPGQVGPRPQTQGWRNYAPGYSAAAALGYGTPEFGSHFAPGLSMPPGALGGSQSTGGGGGGGKGVAGGRDLAGQGGGQAAGPQGPAGPVAPQATAPTGGGRNPSAPAQAGGGRGGTGGAPAKKGGFQGNTTASGGRGGGFINTTVKTNKATGITTRRSPGETPVRQTSNKSSAEVLANAARSGNTIRQEQTAQGNRTQQQTQNTGRAAAAENQGKRGLGGSRRPSAEKKATRLANKEARQEAQAAQRAANEARSTPINTPGSTTTASGAGKTKKKGGAKTVVLGSGRTVLR